MLACRAFERSADYSMILDPPIAFDCHCVTPGAACYDTCNATFHSNWPTHCLGTDGGATLCGCANITLR